MPESERPSITRHAIDELGLDTMTKSADGIVSGSGGVLYAAFTGKAALVMTRKGTPASTIHSLIYRVSEATPDEIERVKQEIADIEAKLPTLDPGSGCSRSRACAASRSGSTTSTSRASCSTSSRWCATLR